jgi:hypothetical protein
VSLSCWLTSMLSWCRQLSSRVGPLHVYLGVPLDFLARRGNITDCHYRVGTASVSNGATTSTYSVLVVLDVGHSNTSRRRSLSLLLLRFLRFLPYCLLVVVTAPGLSGRTAR